MCQSISVVENVNSLSSSRPPYKNLLRNLQSLSLIFISCFYETKKSQKNEMDKAHNIGNRKRNCIEDQKKENPLYLTINFKNLLEKQIVKI